MGEVGVQILVMVVKNFKRGAKNGWGLRGAHFF